MARWHIIRYDEMIMKICIIGAPSSGKSVFARSLSAEMTKRGYSCDLVQEYASNYIEIVGAPLYAWEQLMISLGQYLAEQKTTRDFMVTDAAAFATYVYAQRMLPQKTHSFDWPRYRHLLDMLRQMARISLDSYDMIFLMTHIFPPRSDGVRLKDHLSRKACQEISRDLEAYLNSERMEYHRLKANATDSITKAMRIIEARMKVRA